MMPTETLFETGLSCHQAGRLDEAGSNYRQVLATDPWHFNALHLLGLVCLNTGDVDQGIRLIRECVEIEPRFAEAHNNLGTALARQLRWADAIAAYHDALALHPDYAEAHSNLGLAHHAEGRIADAIACFRRALTLNPALADAENNLGISLQKTGDLPAALAAFNRAIALRPDFAAALSNLGHALHAAGRYDEAVAACQRALALRPDLAEAHNNLGCALRELHRFADAEAAYRRALALHPRHVEAHGNLGCLHQSQNDLDRAAACYDEALRIDPDYAQARFNLGLVQLLRGDFACGWKNYELRWSTDQRAMRRTFVQPLWLGDAPLAGRTILLHAEQGFGDTLQFLRYLPLLAARGAAILLEAPAALKPLLAPLPSITRFIAQGEPLPDFDFHCPLLSLPLAFATGPTTIPPVWNELHASAEKKIRWQKTLSVFPFPRVGVVWSGNPHHRNDRNRSVPLALFRSLFADAPCQFFTLQPALPAADLRALAAEPNVTDLSAQIHDFADSAAIIEHLDLVISVDTSVVHLAGSLGKPVWILLPFAPDWRWQLDREDSPWYPSARLFRQTTTGDWTDVLARVRTELARTAAG